MNLTRVISGVIGFPIVAIVLIFGNKYVIDIAFAIIAAMSLHEYFNSFKGKANPVIWIGYVACSLIAFIHIIPSHSLIQIIGILVPAFILLLFLQVILTNMKTTVKDIAITFFGICYIALFLMFIPILREVPNGKLLVWYIIFAAWGTDIFAYVAGRTIGKHKFSKISPNKTIEGCLGGAIGATAIILIYTWVLNTYFSMQMNYLIMAGIGILLSIIGQIGDFAASAIKRYVGIKDFSNLIPGHGGMLDRIDSIIFISPFAYFLLMLIR